jgi:cob(I)alamin adenosyltransferase
MKGKISYGELKAVKRLRGFTIEQYGRPDFVDRDNPARIDRELAAEGLGRARTVIRSRKHDIVILDEINVAVEYGLIKAGDVIELMQRTPKKMELILTGRYMPQEFAEYADLISEVREIKHYFQKKAKARRGFEY